MQPPIYSIKVNGTQCGSPAMRDEKHCFFHLRFQPKNLGDSKLSRLRGTFMLPILEDANSIQVALADVMRMIFMQQIDHRSAAPMLYALQTASANVRATSLEPEMPTRVGHRSRVRGAASDWGYGVVNGCGTRV